LIKQRQTTVGALVFLLSFVPVACAGSARRVEPSSEPVIEGTAAVSSGGEDPSVERVRAVLVACPEPEHQIPRLRPIEGHRAALLELARSAGGVVGLRAIRLIGEMEIDGGVPVLLAILEGTAPSLDRHYEAL